MEISYDPAKNAKNIAERGLSFDRAAEFAFATAVVRVDDSRDYGETRYSATGYIGPRLYVVVFALTAAGIRVISLRKANEREVRAYAKTKS
jgi:uncharacterized protein